MKRKIAKRLAKGIEALGFEVEFSRIRKPEHADERSEKLNLNIGAGNYTLPHFKSLDFYTPHYYGSLEDFLKERIAYDIRSDNIPFEEGTVDNIYINHVIEHIETEYIEHFLAETFRVLKTGGCLRIGCPDAKFLYEVSSFQNDYWEWRKPWFAKNRDDGEAQASQFDALISMLATQRFQHHHAKSSDKTVTENDVADMNYLQLCEHLRNDIVFRADHPGDHINNWDFERLQALGLEAGFRHIIESKPKGSVSADMQGPAFDKNHNHMSLYVDMVK